MEKKEEDSTKFTGWFLTLLFIYFYVIAYLIRNNTLSLIAWGKVCLIVYDFKGLIIPLMLEAFAVVYSITVIYQTMKHNRGAVSALRWSVMFMLGIVFWRILSRLPDIRVFIGSFLEFFAFLYLITFLVYLFRAKSLKRMFPKEDRKNTALVWSAWIINLVAFGWLGYAGYKKYHEKILVSPYENAGSVKVKTVILDYATYDVPDGWKIDFIDVEQGLQRVSIISKGKWLVVRSQSGDEKSLREHLLNSVITLGNDDDYFISQDETTTVSLNGCDAYISRFIMNFEGDTLKCAFASVFDSQTNRNATLSFLSDSLISDKELIVMMGRVSFANPIQENK